MIIDVMREAFLWSFIINMGILCLWAGCILGAHNWIYQIHSRFFRISEEQFDMIHYGGMTLFKVFLFAFNLVPYFALRIAG